MRSHELTILLNEIRLSIGKKPIISVNDTASTEFPLNRININYHLPHLQASIYPSVIIGKGRTGVFLVMGIPTVRRKNKAYLMETLKSLLQGMSEEEKKTCMIVVFVAEVDLQYVINTAESIRVSFPNEVLSGVLEVISAPAFYYPNFNNLKGRFGDSNERVRWRTKQNLDYSFLMMYAQPRGTFYLQLEDDIIAKPDYMQTIKTFLLQQKLKEWMILEFSQLGLIGKLFRCRDLPMIAEFILMFYKDKPIDWLLDHLLWVKVCNPEKNAKHCEDQKAVVRIRHKPSLFQHVGLHSSLTGKIQHLEDRDFLKNKMFKSHANPPAKVSTSMTAFQHFTLEKAYKGVEAFWAFTPVAGDYIQFEFAQPLHIERYFFRSGSFEHPGDKLFNATVDISSVNINLQYIESNGHLKHVKTKDGYFEIGTFEDGIAEGTVNPSLGKIKALRISIHSNSPMWVLLSEIFIKPGFLKY